MEALKEYVAREGHARVASGGREGGFPLGRWMVDQRAKYERGELSAARANELASVAGWEWVDLRAQKWEEAFSLLSLYVGREGHARVPPAYVEGTFNLGAWINTQRQSHRRGRLAGDRAKRLAALPGWEWRPSEDRRHRSSAGQRRKGSPI
jgi:hypothetical protein